MKKFSRWKILIYFLYIAITLMAIAIIVGINYPRRDDWLMWAAKGDHCWMAKGLLAAGVDADVRDEEGRAPLHWAAYYGSTSTAEILVFDSHFNMNLFSQDKQGRYPDDLAAEQGHAALAQWLQKKALARRAYY